MTFATKHTMYQLAAAVVFTALLMLPNTAIGNMERYETKGVVIVNPTKAEPFSFLDATGQPQGFLIDYWHKWSQKTGIQVHFKIVPWTQTMDMIANGEADIHGGLFFSEERAKFLDFSDPIYPIESNLFVRADDTSTTALIFANHTIGVLSKGYAEYFIKKQYPDTAVRAYPSLEAMIQAMLNNEINALITDTPALIIAMRHEPKGVPLRAAASMYVKDLHAGVRKDDAQLYTLLKQGMADITPDERNLLEKKWFVPKHADYLHTNLLPIISAIAMILSIFVGIWIIRRISSVRS